MNHSDNCFTPFQTDISEYTLPERFTFPFCYEPHPLSDIAAQELQQHIITQNHWFHPFGLSEDEPNSHGKMFGVLVVRNQQGELGYLSGFSGLLAGKLQQPGFVPPLFDRFAEDDLFATEANQIAQINRQVRELKQNPDVAKLSTSIKHCEQQAQVEIEAHRQVMIQGRKQRKALRNNPPTDLLTHEVDELFIQLAQQSVAEKNQLKFLKQKWDLQLQSLQQELQHHQAELDDLKQQRKQLSAALQSKLFSQYRFLNQYGEEKTLIDIFALTANPIPPAGAGECAAPKLLQYAFSHQLKPIAMAEFWWGKSPSSEIRQHKKYYPACHNKCFPILDHMLQGIKLDDNPLLTNPAEGKEIEIIYQDDAIVVVNKPAEFLSVPGVNIKDSVLSRLEQQFPEHEGPFTLHRLDMSTSGILVFALTRRANKSLHKQFITRKVEKRYIALLNGELTENSGDIELPLRGDLNDRPRQMVCYEHGKPAQTHWEKIANHDGYCRVYLYPKTGRTHQLRVHCAHHKGLNMAIVGDDLYGTKGRRLHLHAESLSFDHPYTKQRMTFEVSADF